MAVAGEVGGLPGRIAVQLHLARRRVMEAVLHVVGQHVGGPGAEGALAAVGRNHLRLAGEDRPPAQGALEQGVVAGQGPVSILCGEARGHDDRIEEGDPPYTARALRSRHQADRAAHGVPAQHGVADLQDLQHGLEVGNEVVPVAGRVLEPGRQAGKPMAALVNGDNPQPVRERPKDRTIRQGVEAVRMGEDDVHRAVLGAHLDGGPIAPDGRQVEAQATESETRNSAGHGWMASPCRCSNALGPTAHPQGWALRPDRRRD